MKKISSIFLLLNIVSAWAGQHRPSFKEKYTKKLEQRNAQKFRKEAVAYHTLFMQELDKVCTSSMPERAHIDSLVQDCLFTGNVTSCQGLVSLMETIFANAQYTCAHKGFDKAYALAEEIASISQFKKGATVAELSEINKDDHVVRLELQDVLVRSRCTLCITATDFENALIKRLESNENLNRLGVERIVVDRQTFVRAYRTGTSIRTVDAAPFAILINMAKSMEQVVSSYKKSAEPSPAFFRPDSSYRYSKAEDLAWTQYIAHQYRRDLLKRPVRIPPLPVIPTQPAHIVDDPSPSSVPQSSAGSSSPVQTEDTQEPAQSSNSCAEQPTCIWPSFATMIGINSLFGTPCRVCEK